MLQIFGWIEAHSQLVVGLTAIAAVVVSAISVILGVRASIKQMEHNRNSVRPVAAIRLGDYEHKLCVKFVNIGLGPLIVDELKVTSSSGDSWSALIEAMPVLPDDITWTNFASDLDGQPIGAGEERFLIQLEFEEDDLPNYVKVALEEVRRALMDLTVHIRYEDIYGVEMPLCERDLEWFGRTLD